MITHVELVRTPRESLLIESPHLSWTQMYLKIVFLSVKTSLHCSVLFSRNSKFPLLCNTLLFIYLLDYHLFPINYSKQLRGPRQCPTIPRSRQRLLIVNGKNHLFPPPMEMFKYKAKICLSPFRPSKRRRVNGSRILLGQWLYRI